MTPQERAQFEQMKRDIELLKRVDDIDNIKFLKEKLIGQKVGANDSAVQGQVSITIGAGGGTDTDDVLDYPDGFLKTILQDGSLVYIPYYLGSRF